MGKGRNMSNYKQTAMQFLSDNGVRFTDLGENVLRVVYNGENAGSISILVAFDEDGDEIVEFGCMKVMNMKGKEPGAILVCNELNKYYRWVKFYIDDDGDIICKSDAYIDVFNCGKVCQNMLTRMASIIDEAFPILAKAKFR